MCKLLPVGEYRPGQQSRLDNGQPVQDRALIAGRAAAFTLLELFHVRDCHPDVQEGGDAERACDHLGDRRALRQDQALERNHDHKEPLHEIAAPVCRALALLVRLEVQNPRQSQAIEENVSEGGDSLHLLIIYDNKNPDVKNPTRAVTHIKSFWVSDACGGT